jgi:hypothetical protein
VPAKWWEGSFPIPAQADYAEGEKLRFPSGARHDISKRNKNKSRITCHYRIEIIRIISMSSSREFFIEKLFNMVIPSSNLKKPEVRSQKSGVRSQKSEVRSQEAGRFITGIHYPLNPLFLSMSDVSTGIDG